MCVRENEESCATLPACAHAVPLSMNEVVCLIKHEVLVLV